MLCIITGTDVSTELRTLQRNPGSSFCLFRASGHKKMPVLYTGWLAPPNRSGLSGLGLSQDFSQPFRRSLHTPQHLYIVSGEGLILASSDTLPAGRRLWPTPPGHRTPIRPIGIPLLPRPPNNGARVT